MRKFFLILSIFSVWFSSSYSQTVGSISIIPANATSSDNLKVVATTSFPGGPCAPFSPYSFVLSHDTVVIDEIYCYESNSGGCSSTDTFPIGQLTAGNYVIRFKLSSTSTAGPCGQLAFSLKDIGIQNFTVTGGTTGIANTEPGRVEIFPNPASDFVTFSFFEKMQSDAEIKIFDASGATVKKVFLPKEAGDSKFRIDLSRLSAGVYMYSIKTNEKSVLGKLVIAD